MKSSEQPRRLDSLGDSIWSIQEPVRFGPLRIRTRMTVVRLDDGALWIHSPLAPAPDLVEALDALGRVRYVVAPNKSHSLFFESFLAAYPSAEAYVAPGLGRKLGHDRYTVLGRTDPFGPRLTPYFIAGLPVLNETVWYHTTSRSLILSDLLFCFGENNQPLMRLVARMLGVYKTLGMSRSMRWATRDRDELAESVRPLLSLAVDRLILAHDQVIDDDPAAQMARAFASLGDLESITRP